MKRDLDLIRSVLLAVEAEETQVAIPGYTEKQVLYHCALAIEAGLLSGQTIPDAEGQPYGVIVQRLTWAGHDFLDASRSETLWQKAKDQILKSGGSWTFEVVQTLLTELAKRALLP